MWKRIQNKFYFERIRFVFLEFALYVLRSHYKKIDRKKRRRIQTLIFIIFDILRRKNITFYDDLSVEQAMGKGNTGLEIRPRANKRDGVAPLRMLKFVIVVFRHRCRQHIELSLSSGLGFFFRRGGRNRDWGVHRYLSRW